ncbi:hypothetical protein [Paracoccus sphaerophysae]|uniref:hypothetical protein n=1 Tax=Paracoccus sphaerophysae TaxID=690417 RepID=UPI0012EC931B|nr:hypothetical protein [Paracoccus sphaerophysae]
MKQDVEILFVVDPPKLIIEAILLILSIRARLGNCRITACVPNRKYTALPKQFFDLAEKADVRILEFQDSPFLTKYPHGNKILALCARDRVGGVIFLDTDTVIWRGFDPSQLIKQGSVSVCPEGRRTWGKFSQAWSDVYSMFDLPYPTRTVKMVRTNAISAPYYNAGVIAFNDEENEGNNFPSLWLETALRIDENENIHNKRPWLDQISLPVCIARAEMHVNELGEEWNFSLSRKHDSPSEISRIDSANPYIIHYHNAKFFRDTKFSGYLDDIIAEYTIFESYEQMTMDDLPQRSRALTDIEVQLRKIRAKNKDAWTLDDRKELSNLRKWKAMEKSKPRKEVFSEWPDSILTRT